MDPKITRRIERALGQPGLVEALAALPGADLQSLWLEVSRRRAEARTPAGLLADWQQNRFVRPSAGRAVDFAAIDRAAVACLPEGAEVLVLSPLAPLGTCAAVATVSQHKIVSAERGTEVLSDPTNVLALECALRRRALLREETRSATAVHLATSHRVVRAQKWDAPDASTHFGLLALCSAGRDTGSFAFECETLLAHLGWMARFVAALDADTRVTIALTPLDGGPSEALLAERVLGPLAEAHPNATLRFAPERSSGRGYYRAVCFKVFVELGGVHFELGDGGSTDWTGRLLGDRKERLFVSGAGTERVALALAPR